MDFENIKSIFIEYGRATNIVEYEEAYNNLLDRREKSCKAYPNGDWGDQKRIKRYALIMRQVQLHRAISLYEGSFAALNINSVYTMIVSIRALYESTAVLGYMYKRLYSWLNNDIEGEVVDKDICTLLLGGREGGIKMAPPMKNILSIFEEADKVISMHILGGNSKKYDLLMDCYKYLCEFSHPNYHSNSVSFDTDKDNNQFVFKYGERMREFEFNIIEYMLLCIPIFLDLYDKFGDICNQDA